jgi:hypothetical protein
VRIHADGYIHDMSESATETNSLERYTAFQGRDQANLEMDLNAVIELVPRCNWRLTLSESRDTLAGHDRASLEMQLNSEIE